MLKLHERGTMSFSAGRIADLDAAAEVSVEREINEIDSIYFKYPANDEKAALIKENMLVSLDGQGYIILKKSRVTDGTDMLEITASDIFSTLGRAKHIQNIPDMIGVPPSDVFKRTLEGSQFTAFTEAELQERDMTWFDSDGHLIDFFTIDKTNIWDAALSIIENAGRGEIYRDNFKVAIVKRIGRDNGVRLTLDKNMENLTVTTDMDSVVTRLYPYGTDDMHIGSVNNDVQYIDSPNTAIYGIREGYRDYSDYTDPEKIKMNAEWEFDERNEDRIDVPSISVSGKLVDLSKLAEYGDIEKINLGDTVHVYDNDGAAYTERVIKLTEYPFEPKETAVEIGHIEVNPFSFIWQLYRRTKKHDRSQTTSGGIASRSLSGTINSTRNNVRSENELLKIVGDLLTIEDGRRIRIRLGNYGGEFVFMIYDKSGNRAIYLNENGEAVFAGSIETDKDAKIGRRIDITVNDETSEDYSGVRFLDSGKHVLGQVCCREDGTLWLMAQDFMVGGAHIATDADIKALSDRINAVERKVE